MANDAIDPFGGLGLPVGNNGTTSPTEEVEGRPHRIPLMEEVESCYYNEGFSSGYRRDPSVESVTEAHSNESRSATLAGLSISGLDRRQASQYSLGSEGTMMYSSSNDRDNRRVQIADRLNADVSVLERLAALEAQSQARGPTHGFVRSTVQPPQLGVTGLSAPSGLEIRHVARSDAQLNSAGVISRHDRGITESDRLKHKRGVVVSFDEKFGLSRILSIITSSDMDQLNLATECIGH